MALWSSPAQWSNPGNGFTCSQPPSLAKLSPRTWVAWLQCQPVARGIRCPPASPEEKALPAHECCQRSKGGGPQPHESAYSAAPRQPIPQNFKAGGSFLCLHKSLLGSPLSSQPPVWEKHLLSVEGSRRLEETPKLEPDQLPPRLFI